MNKIKKNHNCIFSINDQGEINYLRDFIESLFSLRNSINNRKLWYRGLSNCSYELQPSIGRRNDYLGEECILLPAQEEALLHRFRRRIGAQIGKLITPIEALFLARHHKLPTRLLDWTANALYGLYFSCYEEISISFDGSLWAMKCFDDTNFIDVFDIAKKNEKDLLNYFSEKSTTPDDKCTNDAVKIINPFYGSERIIAQDGAFTFHTDPWKPLTDYENIKFQEGKLDISALYHWKIPHGRKLPLIKELSGLGITHRTLFPDLDGIAKSLLDTEVLWNRESV